VHSRSFAQMRSSGFNPLNAVGLLWHIADQPRFLGSCFALRWGNYFVTASHCVGDLSAEQIGVMLPGLAPTNRADAVMRHDTADITVVRLAPFEVEPAEPFWGVAENAKLGETFHAFGWPEEFGGDEGPTPRLFAGHYQRFVPRYRSHMGYEYRAGEMSIPFPGGLTGGPIFRQDAGRVLTGMAVENVEAETVLDSVVDVQEDGSRYTEISRKILTYGIAVMLNGVAKWLDDCIPPRSFKESSESSPFHPEVVRWVMGRTRRPDSAPQRLHQSCRGRRRGDVRRRERETDSAQLLDDRLGTGETPHGPTRRR
jgi:hypothetical protein